MNKYGIVTLYYNNYNCGGLLQALALQETVEKLGVICEQIALDRTNAGNNFLHEAKRNNPFNRIKKIKNLPSKVMNLFYQDMYKIRINGYKKFQGEIPHSANIYNLNSLSELDSQYDGFICGSDQIWNPYFCTEADFLRFSHKTKIAYAASVGVTKLPLEVKKRYISYIDDFSAVSVREKNSVDLLSDSKNKIGYVVDPTFLLTKSDWEEKIPTTNYKNYAFVYFLGDSFHQRKIAKNIAKKSRKEILTFRHLKFSFRFSDLFFGENIHEFTPFDFISYIANSDLVITDSFHAVVFSIIFGKQFYIINRFKDSDAESQNNRIADLLDKYEIGKRTISEINEEVEEINYDEVQSKVNIARTESLEWLKGAIKEGKSDVGRL